MQVQSLGRYRIEKELGRGAMGRVFLAYDPEIDRRVAIKTIQIFSTLPQSERASARERFVREARSAGKLLHPGIVTIFDVGEADGVPYLAMEFVEGATLDTFCREDELLPRDEVVGLVAGAAEALGFAHERGIVHRDVKPANLMRVSSGAVKIMDFGLAKNSTTSMTHDGTILGTPNYMSPEQVRGEALDGRSDLFSLGVVCYELLTGAKPFAGDSVSSVLYRIVNEAPSDAPLHLDRVTPSLAVFLERALQKNPADRFGSGAALAAALRKAGAAGSAPVLDRRAAPPVGIAAARPSRPRPGDSKGVRRAGRWILLGALAAVAAAVAAVVFLARPTPPVVPMLETRIRTEPPGLPVMLDGAPLTGSVIRFSAQGPFGLLSATQGCREMQHRIDPSDGGRDIVLVADPSRAEVSVDPGIPGARVSLNGTDAGAAPATIALDLCQENTISVAADGYESSIASIPAKATPLDARTAAAAIRLLALPTGRLVLPAIKLPVAYFIDGKPVNRTGDGLEIPAGAHEVRVANEERFVDVTTTVVVPEGGVATAEIAVPALAQLAVQTFPPNCRVAIKRGDSAWRLLGESPLRYEVAAGRYVLRVEAPVSGESREQAVALAPGANAPVRVSFGRSGR